MEHTGIYKFPLVKYLIDIKAKIWIESGIQIKKSLGITRGKNDKVDSERIAMYAFSNAYRIKLWTPPRPIIEKLNALLVLRNRLLKSKKQLAVPVQEQKGFVDKDIEKLIKKHSTICLNNISKEVDKIDKEIDQLIKSDERIDKIFKLITSVDGIGTITASYIITTTNEFINIDDPKKYACYSGVIPFEHSSGTSIRGKNRVSHMANKTIKTLLHLSALAAIKGKGELYNYYMRKQQEGKNKMSIINAIRNKLVLRVFACVREDRPYEKIFNFSLA